MRDLQTARWAVLLGGLVACQASSSPEGDDPLTPGIGGAEGSGGTLGTGGTGGGSDSNASAPGDPSADGDEDGSALPAFDLGHGGDFCQSKAAGVHCHGTTAVLCNGQGATEDTTACAPDLCIDGEGCVVCEAGQWTCKGPRVMACNTDAAPYWEEVDVCDPAAGEYCDVTVGGCSPDRKSVV